MSELHNALPPHTGSHRRSKAFDAFVPQRVLTPTALRLSNDAERTRLDAELDAFIAARCAS